MVAQVITGVVITFITGTWGTIIFARSMFFLEKMKNTNVVLEDKDQMVAEARFLRAFVYFNLIERFGGVPIVDQVYELGAQVHLREIPLMNALLLLNRILVRPRQLYQPSMRQLIPITEGLQGMPVRLCFQRLYLYCSFPSVQSNKRSE